jgi:hypothetical protein
LTKVGGNQFSLSGVTVDPALGNVDVIEGSLSLETSTSGLGNPASSLLIHNNATLQLFNLAAPLNKQISMGLSGGDNTTLIAGSGTGNTIAGAMVFNGAVIAGFDSVRTLQLKWWNNGRSDVVYTRRGPARIRVLSPDAVIVTDALRSQRTDSAGVTTQADFAATSVWQKRPEGWRIVAVHESTAGR